MAERQKKKINISEKSLVLFILTSAVITGIFLWANRREASKISTKTNSSISTTIGKPGSYNEESRELTSPVIRDVKTQENYSIKVRVPSGWEIKRNEFAPESHTVVLEKDGYRFTISGPAIERSVCNFAVNGNVTPLLELEDREGEIGEIYDRYISLDNKLMDLRLGRIYAELHKEDNFIDFNVCQLDTRDTVPTWVGITKIGYVNLRTPYNYDEKIVDEIAKTISDIELISYQ